MRKLHLTLSGRWYVALTTGLGVVALLTGNNVLYLIESLLLSGLILSGVLSERSVAAIDFEITRLPASAESPSRDKLKVFNRRKFVVYSVEIGEWRNGKFLSFAYVPRLSAKSSAVYHSRQLFRTRGVHRWDALAIATSYPFGFARKIRLIQNSGERIVWPRKLASGRKTTRNAGGGSGLRSGLDIADAEVRQLTSDDDSRMIVWTLSARGGTPLVRVRKSENENPEVFLDLRTAKGDDFESRIETAALPFHELADEVLAGTLTLLDRTGKRRIHGRNQVLNQLALLAPTLVSSAMRDRPMAGPAARPERLPRTGQEPG